ncbi:32773_t:CDS:2, partial [Gigaspora margarita]
EEYNEWSDARYFYRTKIKKVKCKACKQSRKPVELGYLNETNDEYNASWRCRNSTDLEIVEMRRPRSTRTRRRSRRKELDEDLYKRKKKEEIKNVKNDSAELLQELLVIRSALPQKITRGKEEIMRPNTILEPEDLSVNLIKDFLEEILAEVEDKDSIFEFYQTDKMDSYVDFGKDKSTKKKRTAETEVVSGGVIDEFGPKKEEKTQEEEAAHLDVDLPGLTVTEVLDAYYDLDETVEETYNDAEFDSNEVQKNKFEVLLKEVTTEYDALIQKLALEKKEPIQETRAKINTNKDRKKDNKETIDNIKALIEEEKLGHACEVWMERVKEFQGAATRNRAKVERPPGEIFDRIYEVGYEFKKDEDKGIKVGTEFLLTYPRFAIADCTENVEDQEDCQTENGIRVDDRKSVPVKIKEMDDEMITKTDKMMYENVGKFGLEKIMRFAKVDYADGIENPEDCQTRDEVEKDRCEVVDRKLRTSKAGSRYQNELGVNLEEACKWCLGSTKDANLSSQFDPGGRNNSPVKKAKSELNIKPTEGERPDTKGLESKIEVEKETAWNYWKYAEMDITNKKKLKELDPDKRKKNRTKISPKRKALCRVCEKKGIEDQFQRSIGEDKKTGDLSESDREMTQHTECAENGEVVTSAVGEYTFVAKAMDNEIVGHLFDPGGKCLPEHPVRP